MRSSSAGAPAAAFKPQAAWLRPQLQRGLRSQPSLVPRRVRQPRGGATVDPPAPPRPAISARTSTRGLVLMVTPSRRICLLCTGKASEKGHFQAPALPTLPPWTVLLKTRPSTSLLLTTEVGVSDRPARSGCELISAAPTGGVVWAKNRGVGVWGLRRGGISARRQPAPLQTSRRGGAQAPSMYKGAKVDTRMRTHTCMRTHKTHAWQEEHATLCPVVAFDRQRVAPPSWRGVVEVYRPQAQHRLGRHLTHRGGGRCQDARQLGAGAVHVYAPTPQQYEKHMAPPGDVQV